MIYSKSIVGKKNASLVLDITPVSMSPKLHLEYALLCITLHKNEKCKKV
jgi:hypothetical protein